MALHLETVSTDAQLEEFLELPWQLHPEHLHMPIMADTIRSWYDGTAAHPGRIELVLVRDDDGAVRARSTVHTHDALEEKLGIPTLLFGATEFADHESLEVLMEWAQHRAQELGKRQLLGPAGLDTQERCGVITSGFAEPTFLDQPWNPSRVPESFEALGFTRWTEGSTWIVDLADVDVERPAPEDFAARDVELVKPTRRSLPHLIPGLAAAINEAMGRQHYFVPMDQEQFAASLKDLSLLLDFDIVALAVEPDSQRIVSHSVCIPDISPVIRSSHGDPGLLDQLRLLLGRRRWRREALLIVQGTHADHAGTGLLSLLSREVLWQLRRKGYRTLRVTFIVDGNVGSSRQFERVGGRPLHGTTFYRRDVPAAPGVA